MPFSFNATQEEEKVETEELRDAMKQAIASYAQAIPALASQGQDPSDILRKLSYVISARQKGKAIEVAIQEAFEPENPAPAAAPGSVSPESMGMPGESAAGDGQLPPGLGPTGQMQGVAPGQIAQAVDQMFNHCLHLLVLAVKQIYKQQSHGDNQYKGGRKP